MTGTEFLQQFTKDFSENGDVIPISPWPFVLSSRCGSRNPGHRRCVFREITRIALGETHLG